ncbi:uncharacterized protein LOC107690489 [Sinocyclocheilus anshuiensis]|uniref:uncharacterized protein LOC107690489 n=1 Tax=Sinocyclocheilus anshuiensis TaxID=1608454 RepID=UPI0007B903FF|nr:PREDICTED: uncharacterized protein LOC107690489 [Sinocyclocheilus anshuiensis]
MNLREPERLPFKPFEGRLKAPTPENIALAKDGKLKVSLTWLNCKKVVPDCDGQPITGSAEHYALYDPFHEDNTKDARDALQKLGLVPQLAGIVNSQVAEQLFAKMKKKNKNYLNMALPSTHLFLMRNIIYHYNCHKNKQRLGDIKKAFDTKIAMNIHSQAVLAEAVAPTAALGTPPTAAIDYSLTFKPFAKEWNPIQDKLLNYVLDTGRPAAEIIVKEGPLCITREEFWSLGLLRDMDSHIGNACFKLIHEAAQQHGKDIYIEDMFVVPTWKDTQSNITANFPEDVDMKDVLVFPGWTDANGSEHFVLCGLPRQICGNDCVIFMLMYTLSIVTSTGFQFQEMDMPLIRKWWCLLLMERFKIDGYGQRFAFWTDEARSLLQGTLQPIFRVPRKRAITEDAIIYGLAGLQNLSLQDAEQAFLSGPNYHHRLCNGLCNLSSPPGGAFTFRSVPVLRRS